MDEVRFAYGLKGLLDGDILYNRECLNFYSANKLGRDLPSMWHPWHYPRHTGYDEEIPHITNEGLRELFRLLRIELEKLDDLNVYWSKALANYFKVSQPQTLSEMESFARKINSHRRRKGPTWLEETNCQELFTRTRPVISRIENLLLQIDGAISQEYGHLLVTGKDFGDQRASDLIDKADATTPKTAIKLLQKALTFGTTGIQASKAYFGLGMRYEDVGNIELAIENYSKAIQAYKSFGMVHFWRGRLYYQQQKWIEARADFEKALSFSVENGLPSPEKEEARRYLEELSKLSQ